MYAHPPLVNSSSGSKVEESGKQEGVRVDVMDEVDLADDVDRVLRADTARRCRIENEGFQGSRAAVRNPTGGSEGREERSVAGRSR